jgi:hypothetical protein
LPALLRSTGIAGPFVKFSLEQQGDCSSVPGESAQAKL